MSAVRKFIFIFVCLFFLVFFKTPVFAQATIPQASQAQYLAPNTNADVPNNLHNWTQNVMIEVISAMTCQLAGIDPTTTDRRCLGIDSKTGKIGYVNANGGLLGVTANMIAQLYTPPAHTADYLRYLSQNFGIVKPSYAADPGYGFKSISPLSHLWVVFRNLVYALFVIVFIIVGIAIMFRVKIDPRTVMTIQNQIPKIVIGIILVTFSFAIAGLLIDLMYVASYLGMGVIFSGSAHPAALANTGAIVGATNPINALNAAVQNSGGFGSTGISNLTAGASGAVGGHLGDLFANPPGRVITGAIGGILGLIIGGSLGSSLPFGLGSIFGVVIGGFVGGLIGPTLVGTLLGAVAFLIIVVAIIASLFRLWFQLILAYISILVDIIFAPIWIVAGLIPGSKINFSSWIRSLLANLAAFPAVLAMFALARVFMDEFVSNTAQNTFVPPLIGNPATPNEIGSLIALGFILATPSVVKLMKTVFGAPQAGFGPILGGILTGVGIIGTAGRPVLPRLYRRHVNPVTGEITTHGVFKNIPRNIRTGIVGTAAKPTIVTVAANSPIARRLGDIRRRITRQPPRRTAPPAGGGTTAPEEPENIREGADAPLPEEPQEEA